MFLPTFRDLDLSTIETVNPGNSKEVRSETRASYCLFCEGFSDNAHSECCSSVKSHESQSAHSRLGGLSAEAGQRTANQDSIPAEADFLSLSVKRSEMDRLCRRFVFPNHSFVCTRDVICL